MNSHAVTADANTFEFALLFARMKPCPLLQFEDKFPPAKLYLNLKISQVGPQPLRRLIVNDEKTQAAWAFKIERAIVDENAFCRLTLSDGKRDSEDAFFRFARVDVTGAEENLEALAEVKSFDAILIEF